MTYGIEIRNEFDDNLVDVTEGLTYYKKSSGTSLLTDSLYTFSSAFGANVAYIIPTNFILAMSTGVIPYYLDASRYPSSLYTKKISFAGQSWKTIVMRDQSVPSDRTHNYAEPVSTNKNDLVFFKMPTEGIMAIQHVWLPFTGTDKNGNTIDVGLTAFCVPYHTWSGASGLEYQVVSNDLPSRTSDNGLVVYDDDGSTILFDTSREIASFADHIEMTEAEVQDVIDNGTTYTFTLRQVVLNPWITSEGGGGASYKVVYTGSGATGYALRVRATSSTEITVDRATMAASSFSWSSQTYSLYEGVTFIIADFG